VLGIFIILGIGLIILAVAVEFGQLSRGYLEIFSIKTPISSLPPVLVKIINYIISILSEIVKFLKLLFDK